MGSSHAALIVIDMLVDFFDRQTTLKAERARLVACINDLAAEFRRFGQPVIWVRQEFKADLTDAFLVMRRHKISITIEDTPGCQILPELEREPEDHVIVKKRYSAFFGTTLDEILAREHIRSLVLAGVNTHACVRTTAIDAYQRDYETILASDCMASYDAAWHEETLRYLGDAIAPVMNLTTIVDLLAGRTYRERQRMLRPQIG
jgi:nicotinamidase-related amidase